MCWFPFSQERARAIAGGLGDQPDSSIVSVSQLGGQGRACTGRFPFGFSAQRPEKGEFGPTLSLALSGVKRSEHGALSDGMPSDALPMTFMGMISQMAIRDSLVENVT